MPYTIGFDHDRSETAIRSCIFTEVFWYNCRAAVLLVSFLDIHSCCRFYRTSTSFYLDHIELSLGRAELVNHLRTADWEVPTPPVQSIAGSDGSAGK